MTIQEITTTRANPLIDPSMHVWHGEVALYLFLGGLVAGIMVITGLAMLREPDAPRSRAFSLLPWAGPIWARGSNRHLQPWERVSRPTRR